MDSDMSEKIAYLRQRCVELGLEGAEILDKYSDDQLAQMYNGMGPDSFPDWLVDTLDFISPSLAPPCMIHDVEWLESNGSYDAFTASNDRLRRNGKRVAKAVYPWYSLNRYLVMWDARILSNACQTFGWHIWVSYADGRTKGASDMFALNLYRVCH